MKYIKHGIVLAVSCAMILASCSSNDPAGGSIVGVWKEVKYSTTSCADPANNKETICTDCSIYMFTESSITFSTSGASTTGTYTVNGSSLTMSFTGACGPQPCTPPVSTSTFSFTATPSTLTLSQPNGVPSGCNLSMTLNKVPLPLLTTTAVSAIDNSTATSGGNVIADGGSAVTARGVCFGPTMNPGISSTKTNDGTGTGIFTSNLTGLTPGTTYYVRAYAISANGTSYGNQISFLTTAPPVTPGTGTGVTDIDGNSYASVILGTQEWLTSNLKTTRYVNGDLIANVTVDATWAATATGAWCNNNNNSGLDAVYGKLYNWYAVTDSRKLCPTGWHSPSDPEWTTLVSLLGGDLVAGSKLKETGTSHWSAPNVATNESNFSAVPGGYRNYLGGFIDIGFSVVWWSSSATNTTDASYLYLRSSDGEVNRTSNKKEGGFSVRCVKD